MRLFKVILICLVLIGGSLAGCTSEPEVEVSTLTIAVPTEIFNMDLYGHGEHVIWHAVRNMYSFLFGRDTDGEIIPDLVESYENINDTTWEFTIKQGVKFHNGDELTAEDVKFTLERAATDETLIQYKIFKVIKEIKVKGDYNFQIITAEPNPLLINLLARPAPGIYPKKYIEENGWDYFFENPVGSGPFKFSEWDPSSFISFDKFEDYHEGPSEDWDKVVFRTIPESSTRLSELLTGGVDIISNVTSNLWEQIYNNEQTYLASGRSQRVAIIVPRATEGSPTADKKVREAIDWAVDDQTIIDTLLGGKGTTTRTRVTPGNFGANKDLYGTYRYDPEKAKQLLEEAGYPDGVELTMQSSNGRYARDVEVAEMVVSMLARVDIKVNLELMEWSNYLAIRRANQVGDLHMVWFANSYYDGYILSSDHLGSDRRMENLGYEHEELRELLTAAKVNMDSEEREEQIQRAQEIIAEECMRIYIYQECTNYGVNRRVDFSPRLDEMIRVYDISKRQ